MLSESSLAIFIPKLITYPYNEENYPDTRGHADARRLHQSIIDKLSNNGFAQPITALLYGGVTGFEDVLSYARSYGWVYYMLTDEKSLQFSLYNGTLRVTDIRGRFPVRLVKK